MKRNPSEIRGARAPNTLRYRTFSALARLDLRRPWLVIALAAALAIASVLYTKARLEFHTGQDDLVTATNRASRDYLRYTNEFPDLDGLIVVIRTAPDPARAERFADRLAARLKADTVNVHSVLYRLDPAAVGGDALLYMSRAELGQMADRLGAAAPMLDAYATRPELATVIAMANRELDAAARPAPAAGSHAPAQAQTESPAGGLIFLQSVLHGMLADKTAAATSLFAALNPTEDRGGIDDGYLSSDNGNYLLMNVAPADGAADGPDPVDAIQADLDAVRAEFPGIDAGMTGGPALARAEAATTQHDMTIGSIIAVASNIALIVIPFRGVVAPFFAIVALLTGVAWSFGFTTLAVGHLNLLSAVFTSVLAGIGINFPIHLMARYDEARARGAALPEAIELAVVNTGTGVFSSACIMALAFLMPMFTDFRGIAELGLVSAAGLFLCLISALLVFPAFLVIRDRRRAPIAKAALKAAPAPRRTTLERIFAKPAWIVAVSVALTVAAFAAAPRVHFDQNVLKLQASEAEAVRFENILMRNSGRSSWFAVSLAKTVAGSDRKAAAFRRLPEVSDVQTITTYIPTHQAEKRAVIARLAAALGSIAVAPAQPGDPRALTAQLQELATRLGAMSRFDATGGVAETEQLARDAIARLQADPRAFDVYAAALRANLAGELARLHAQMHPGAIDEHNLPELLRERFIGKTGLYLVQIYPKGDIWDDAPLSRFVAALRTVDPDVTGPPVQTYNLATIMRQGYERAAALALIAVFIFVFADFRNLRDTLLATVPLIFGGAWLIAAMGLLGWEFNLANLFAVPIIIGMGVDNGVNMLYRWREERDKSSLILTRAVGKSVTICSLTTIAAFAALIPARHRGISSLGWVLSLGVALILLATLIVLPALFELIGARTKSAPLAAASPTPLIPEIVESEPEPAPAEPPRATGTGGL